MATLAGPFRFLGPDSAGDRILFHRHDFGDRPMAAKAKTLHDAFYETLKDVYYAEKQSVRALKKSAKAAEHAELRSAFETHAEESAEQVERLQLGYEDAAKLLEQTLEEEKKTDALLSQIAERINTEGSEVAAGSDDTPRAKKTKA
jgi:ferritin-like metal-binding protein YciE